MVRQYTRHEIRVHGKANTTVSRNAYTVTRGETI